MHPKPFPKALFITGIGTDVGKSYATGWLAKEPRWRENGSSSSNRYLVLTP